MQQFLKIVRWTVGLLFIFSGCIKANDPLGLSYKMQEFFDVWGIQILNDYTLGFALLMNTLEIVTGLALIIQFPYKQTLWLLLSLIVFFSFLTGYALFSGKIKTCGCFGDCIALTPKTSFIKDLVLLVAIVFLLLNLKKVKTTIHSYVGIFILLITTAGVGYGQFYVLKHLPIIDCLPYKVGNDIVEEMKLPEGAMKDSISIQMEFLKDGKTYFFDANHFPENFDTSYVYKDRKEVIVRKGNGLVPAIVDFEITNKKGEDTTQALFSTEIPYILVLAGKIEVSVPWENLMGKLHQKYKLVYVVTSDKEGAQQFLSKENILIGDITMLKTAARVWPTLLIMNGSTIMQKKSYLDFLAQ